MSDKLRFGEILTRAGVLERTDLESILSLIGDSAVDLGEVLVSRGFLDEATMLKTISKALNLPSISLKHIQPDKRGLELIPREFCADHFLLPVEVERSRTGEHLHVAMANPSDVRAIKRVTRKARLRIRPLVASAREIREAIQRWYGGELVEDSSLILEESLNSSMGGENSSENLFDFGLGDLSQSLPTKQASTPPRANSSKRRGEEGRITPPDLPKQRKADLLNALDLEPGSQTSEVQEREEQGFGTLPRRGSRHRPPSERPPFRNSERPRSERLPPLPRQTSRELPPLPPSLRSGNQRKAPRSSSIPPQNIKHSRGSSAPPQGAQGIKYHQNSAPTLVEERGSVEELKGVLDRYVAEINEESSGDGLISQELKRYGLKRSSPESELFAALENTLSRAQGPNAQLLLALIRQLARRGLLDLQELLSDLPPQ